VDRLPPLRVVWWISRWVRIRVAPPAFPLVIAESGASVQRMASYQLLASHPLAPSFDTVVILGQNADVLAKVALVLVGLAPVSSNKPATIHLIREAFDLADGDVQQSFITREAWTGLILVTSGEECWSRNRLR